MSTSEAEDTPVVTPITGSRSVIAALDGERALTIGVTLWFAILALQQSVAVVVRAESLLAAPATIDLTGVADFLSRLFMPAFYVLAAWLSFTRSGPVAKARGLTARVTALAGVTMLSAFTFIPRLEHPSTALLLVSAVLAIVGHIGAVYCLHRLGRSFSVMAQARRLVTDGPYRVVRHPIYLTEEIAIVGVFLPFWSPAAILIVLAHFAVQVLRMRFEEGILTETFPEYGAYAARTPRLVPGLW